MQHEDYIDYAKAYAMLFVILGHINSFNAGVKIWIYAFHMPLFFILSGFVLKPHARSEYSNRVIWKVKRIYVPYMIWALIYAGFSPINLCYVAYGSYNTLNYSGSNTNLWFFPTILVAQIIAEWVVFRFSEISSSSKHKIAIGFIGGALPIGSGLTEH